MTPFLMYSQIIAELPIFENDCLVTASKSSKNLSYGITLGMFYMYFLLKKSTSISMMDGALISFKIICLSWSSLIYFEDV